MEEMRIEQKVMGRPTDSRIEKEVACYDILDELGVSYERVDHNAADTIAACHYVETVLGTPICKNLFLCNRQKTQFYLLLMEGEKVFKTKELSKQLGCARLSFAGPEDLQELMNLTPGSVSVMGLIFDRENRVQLVLDEPIAKSKKIGCHPCINTSTLAFDTRDLLGKILPRLHHEPIVVSLPDAEEE